VSPSTTRKAGSRAVTLDHVATLAGVSRATAARVASGSSHVSAGSRSAVERAIVELDYAAENVVYAPAMVSHSVAVVITEPTTKLFGDPFFSPLLKGIYAALADRQLLMVMLAPQSPKDLELAQNYLLDRHVDGVILASLHGDNPLPAELQAHHIPMVVCGRPPKSVAASCVDSDNRQGGALAVNHLLSLGRKRIAIISGNLDMPSAVDRLNGYRDALNAAGIPLNPTLEEVADYLPQRAHMAMERLLLNHPDVDGVFASSDLMAAAAVRVLHQARKRIPEDVAVIGFDDSPTAYATRPPLSSIRQPIEELGREAVSILMDEMEQPSTAPRQVVFPTSLIIRESTAGPGGIGAAGTISSGNSPAYGAAAN
jgi:DNA-binding LacI/PurR family transcriptional regulator